MVVEIMKNPEDFIMENMKADIAKAGNLFYRYRACRRDASIIYDIENNRHGVVYARTPLQMNDPFDSMVAEWISDKAFRYGLTSERINIDTLGQVLEIIKTAESRI